MNNKAATIIVITFLKLGGFVSAQPFINNAPSIDPNPIPSQTIFADTTLSFPFTVGDPDPGHLDALVVNVSSTVSLFSSLTISGTDSSRTLTAVPLPDITGSTLLGISARDPLGMVSFRSFVLTILPTPPPSSVPDTGSTLGLLSCALAGFGLIARQRR